MYSVRNKLQNKIKHHSNQNEEVDKSIRVTLKKIP